MSFLNPNTSFSFRVGARYAISRKYSQLVSGIEKLFHIQFLHADVYPISYLPSDLQWSDVVKVISTALLISFMACIYPAWRASRVQPADALRFE